MNYEDKILGKLAKLDKQFLALNTDLALLYKFNGLGWKTCQASDSGLVELECWCAECKEYSAEIRKMAQEAN